MQLEINYRKGQTLYLKNDPEQSEYILDAVVYDFHSIRLVIIGNNGEAITVPEELVRKTQDKLKKLGADRNRNDIEDE